MGFDRRFDPVYEEEHEDGSNNVMVTADASGLT